MAAKTQSKPAADTAEKPLPRLHEVARQMSVETVQRHMGSRPVPSPRDVVVPRAIDDAIQEHGGWLAFWVWLVERFLVEAGGVDPKHLGAIAQDVRSRSITTEAERRAQREIEERDFANKVYQPYRERLDSLAGLFLSGFETAARRGAMRQIVPFARRANVAPVELRAHVLKIIRQRGLAGNVAAGLTEQLDHDIRQYGSISEDDVDYSRGELVANEILDAVAYWRDALPKTEPVGATA